MSTEPGDWKPEVGGKVWYFDPNEKQVIRCGTVSFQSEINADHYFLNGSLARHYTLLFPTAEAALASIRVYDLDGKEVVVARDSHAMMELGAAKMLDVYLEALDVVVQSFKDYRSGKLSKDDFDKFIDQSIQTSDDMAARTAAFIDFHNAADRFSAMAAGNEDPCDPSAREITTPTDKRNGDPC